MYIYRSLDFQNPPMKWNLKIIRAEGEAPLATLHSRPTSLLAGGQALEQPPGDGGNPPGSLTAAGPSAHTVPSALGTEQRGTAL